MQVGYLAPLVLSAADSLDPDGTNSSWHYAWSCENVTVPSAPLPCVDANGSALSLLIGDLDSVNITIPADALDPDPGYRFKVLVSKDVRNSTASTRVIVKQGEPPAVSLPGFASYFVNPNDGDDGNYLVVTASVSASAGSGVSEAASVLWTQREGDYIEGTGFGTETDRLSMGFAIYRMTPGASYTFRFTARNAAGVGAYAEIDINVNSPPTSGSCSITPAIG